MVLTKNGSVFAGVKQSFRLKTSAEKEINYQHNQQL